MIRLFEISLFLFHLDSFIHTYIPEIFLSTYYVPGSVLSVRGIIVGNQTLPPPHRIFSQLAKTDVNQKIV